MAFAPVFQRPFSATFDRRAAAAAIPWWLSGGVAAANAIAVYQPKGAASLAASYVNLANPGTYDAAPGTAPTFDADGWVGNGTNQYLTTGVVAVNNMTILVRFSDRTNAAFLFGERSVAFATDGPGVLPADGANQRSYRYGGILNLAPGTGVASGVIGLAGGIGYYNGASDGSGTMAGTAAGTRQMYLLALNQGGSATSFFAGNIQAVAIYNTTLTAFQVAAVSAAMAAL